MTTINTNASNAKALIDFDQGNEQSTEGMTPLEKKLSQPGPLDHLTSKQGLQDETQSYLPGGCVIDDLPEIDLPEILTHDQENTVTVNGEEYVIPEGTISVTVEDGQVLVDGEVLDPSAIEGVFDAIESMSKPTVYIPTPGTGIGGENYQLPDNASITTNDQGEQFITVDGQTFQMVVDPMTMLGAGSEGLDTPRINGFDLPPEISYSVDDEGNLALSVEADVDLLRPLGPLFIDPDLGSIDFPSGSELDPGHNPATGTALDPGMDISPPTIDAGSDIAHNDESNQNVEVNAPIFDPVENIEGDADIGSITYDEDQSQDI